MKRILLCLMVALFATGCLFAKNNDEKMNVMLHIPADTRSAFPVISVQSPVSIQCCWQS